MDTFSTLYPAFFTASIHQRKKLLQPDKYKDIIVNSLRFLVAAQRIQLFAFVIMINHIHLIWRMRTGINPKHVQRDFLKYAAQFIQLDLRLHHPKVFSMFRVQAADRKYQFWNRNSLSIDLRTHQVFLQKLDYIHANPVRAGICKLPEAYRYSSALFYHTGYDNWGFLTHYRD